MLEITHSFSTGEGLFLCWRLLIHFPLARVCSYVGDYSIDDFGAVCHTIKDDALLGVDLENFCDLMRLGVC